MPQPPHFSCFLWSGHYIILLRFPPPFSLCLVHFDFTMQTRSSGKISGSCGMMSLRKTRSGRKHGLTDVAKRTNTRPVKKRGAGVSTTSKAGSETDVENTVVNNCVLPSPASYDGHDIEQENGHDIEQEDDNNNIGVANDVDNFVNGGTENKGQQQEEKEDSENTKGNYGAAAPDDALLPTVGLYEGDNGKTGTEDEAENGAPVEEAETGRAGTTAVVDVAGVTAVRVREVHYDGSVLDCVANGAPNSDIIASPSGAASTGCGPVIVTEDLKNIWRSSLSDVRNINIPNATDTRPMKTMNAFVTKATVFLAYLIVHAQVDSVFPKISKKFQIDFEKHDVDAMCEEIRDSKFSYTRRWNSSKDPQDHICSNKLIGSWLANSINKVKYNATWKVEEGRVVGNKNGLYEPYKEFLEKIGVQFS